LGSNITLSWGMQESSQVLARWTRQNTKACRSALTARQSTFEGFGSDLHAGGLTPNLYRRKHRDAETFSKMPCVFLSTGTTGLAVNIRRVYEVDVAPYQRSLGKGELGFVYRADM
jgi:hypothetical protein